MTSAAAILHKRQNSIAFSGIYKRFGPVIANADVSLSIHGGGIHAIVGENGAGKSTLVKILSGYYQPDAGTILLDGSPVTMQSPTEARRLGIGLVHQKFTLIPGLTVLENILLGDSRMPFFWSAKKEAHLVRCKMQQLGFNFDLFSLVSKLSIGDRQKLEIFKLLWRDSSILILDEPTSQLTPFEAEDILHIANRLAQEGKIVILITHHLKEVAQFANHVTVMRKGRVVGEFSGETITAESIGKVMVECEEFTRQPESISVDLEEPVIELRGVGSRETGRRSLYDIDLTLYPGQVVGIAGVAGSGQEELVQVLLGNLPPERGTIKTNLPDKGSARVNACYVPLEQDAAVAREMSVRDNSAMRDVDHRANSFGPFLRFGKLTAYAWERIRAYDIRPANCDQLASNLSGGNLQRLILSREFSRQAALMIAENPAAGLDAAMCARIERELVGAARSGKAVVVVSPDLDELLRISDRLVVMYSGRIVYDKAISEVDYSSIGLLLGGGMGGRGSINAADYITDTVNPDSSGSESWHNKLHRVFRPRRTVRR